MEDKGKKWKAAKNGGAGIGEDQHDLAFVSLDCFSARQGGRVV